MQGNQRDTQTHTQVHRVHSSEKVDPPRPGIEPVSPTLAGRFFTTEPPGKPLECSVSKAESDFIQPHLKSLKKFAEGGVALEQAHGSGLLSQACRHLMEAMVLAQRVPADCRPGRPPRCRGPRFCTPQGVLGDPPSGLLTGEEEALSALAQMSGGRETPPGSSPHDSGLSLGLHRCANTGAT